MYFTLSLVGLGALLMPFVAAQAPNNIQYSAPAGEKSWSSNYTLAIVPINATAVQASLPNNYTLLDNFKADKSLFPKSFPEGMHPVLLAHGYENEVKVTAAGIPLSIPFLLGTNLIIPFIDALEDGETPFSLPIFGVIGGDNGQLASNLIPALVGSLAGTVISAGVFNPDKAAYLQVDPVNNPGVFTASSEQSVLPNPVSGPGITNPAFSITFSPTAASPYTPHTFHNITNQPQLLRSPGSMCIRSANYFSSDDFNNTYADPYMTKGTVRLYGDTLVSDLGLGVPKGFEGLYNVYGYAATAQTQTSNNEACVDSPGRVDPRAST